MENGYEWLATFFNQVVAEKKVPDVWQRRRRFLMFLDSRIREIVKLSNNQRGLVAGRGTIDAIHAASSGGEHREQRPVHLAFLDLEKAFDRVPREVIWYTLRQHGVPEELLEWVRIRDERINRYSLSVIRFPGGFGLSVLLFVIRRFCAG
ncbi:unnamed protein product [Heligmosomoides polygyrus]|uniref:Reverse transcriptase domain-containing protein n=1 Tax=Heligmosomoides polygyrus TaxID=6339 RepID=A0A183F729_HELPZ|nr:unnamed protein product [Heligmosomoides polygyrus]